MRRGFFEGYLRDADWETCCRTGNLCGALVVTRHGCSPAMPYKGELDLTEAYSDNSIIGRKK